jgi:hypothetical protein
MCVYIAKGDNFNPTSACRSRAGYKERWGKRRKWGLLEEDCAWRSREYGWRGWQREDGWGWRWVGGWEMSEGGRRISKRTRTPFQKCWRWRGKRERSLHVALVSI